MKIFETEISGDKIGLSVSGGGDSIALLYLMHKWANKNKKKIFVATVDHCLREESANEVKAVKNQRKRDADEKAAQIEKEEAEATRRKEKENVSIHILLCPHHTTTTLHQNHQNTASIHLLP